MRRIFLLRGCYGFIVDRDTGELVGTKMRQEAIEINKDVWLNLFRDTDFLEFIKNKYTLATGSLVNENYDEEEEELEKHHKEPETQEVTKPDSKES